MALNNFQKRDLDKKILKFFETHADISFYANEIKDILEEEYSVPAIVASINRIAKKNPIVIVRISNKNQYSFTGNHITISFEQTSFQKDKNKLYIDGVDKDICYYDFITKKFVIKDNAEPYFTGYYKDIFMNLSDYPEWMFNYTTQINTIVHIWCEYDTEITEKMPANLYDFLQKKYNGKLSANNFSEFINITKYKKYHKLVDSLKAYSYRFSSSLLDKFLEKYSFQNLLKMIQTDIIDGIIDNTPFEKITELVNKYGEISTIEEPVIDVNRGITQNIRNLSQLLESKEKEVLEYQLKKLNFINGYSNDKFIVVVPQSQKDKQEEGKQQHNCVGHYYDNSIRRGENFIYFVRRKSNPQHSYVTCRFSKQSNKTVEVRIKNNQELKDTDTKNFIQEVSNIIKEHKNNL